MKKYKTKILETLEWRYIVREDIESYAITSAKTLYENFRHLIENATQEMVYVFYLSTCMRIINYEMTHKGGLNSCIMEPRETYRGAIVNNAASIIVMHNHPSGNLAPSDSDIEITQRLKEAGKTLGIHLRDHIIFSNDNYYSMLENRAGGF